MDFRPSCLLYSRGDGERNPYRGRAIASFPGPVVQLAGSRRSEQGCEVPHDGPLFAEADKQVGNASRWALTACTWLRAPGKNHLSMTSGE